MDMDRSSGTATDKPDNMKNYWDGNIQCFSWDYQRKAYGIIQFQVNDLHETETHPLHGFTLIILPRTSIDLNINKKHVKGSHRTKKAWFMFLNTEFWKEEE